jgi:subtilisin family serine protease
MPNKRRYLVSPAGAEPAAAEKKFDLAGRVPSGAVVRSLASGHSVIELGDDEVADFVRNNPELGIEDDQELERLMPMPGLGFRVEDSTARSIGFQVFAEDGKTPLRDVTIFARGLQATYKGKTGSDGSAQVRVFESELDHAIVSPVANYWSRLVPGDAVGDKTAVSLSPLKPEAQTAQAELVGIRPGSMAASGSGVKVAVIDGGIAKHASLDVKGGFNCLDGQDSSKFRSDDDGHGTHCAGIIAGRRSDQGINGIVPDAELYSLKVFPGGRVSDLLEAIQWAIDNGIDVVNLSLALERPSAALTEVIAKAIQHGVVCVAAAGNDGGAVRYPAAIEGVIAVTAIGYLKSFPEDSAHALRVSEFLNPSNGLFFANFSAVGEEVAFCAPGVAVVSTVPHGLAAWDGTSMAAPFVAGMAALAISAYPALKTGDVRQVLAVREMLAASAEDLDLPGELQGWGVPNATRLVASASLQQAAAKRLAAQREEQSGQLREVAKELEGTRKEIEELLANTD